MTSPAGDLAASALSTRSTTSLSAGASFACTQCPKLFTRRENLSRHLKNHVPNGSHRCTVCSKAFTRSDLLKRHDEIHSRDTEAIASNPESHQGRKRRKTATDKTTTRATLSGDAVVPQTPDSYFDPAIGHSQPSQSQPLNHETQATTSISNPWDDVTANNIDSLSALSPELYLHGRDLDSWFSDDFFAALQETGYDWLDIDGTDVIDSSAFPACDNTGVREVSADFHGDLAPDRTSEISSPPNEPSEEDKWPFAWNPRSNPLMHAENTIAIPSDHEIFRFRDSTYDISAATYQKVIRYVHFWNDHVLFANQKLRVNLPELAVMNLFISLFFKHFYQQMPVIHPGTLNMDKDLPPVLLAMMMVIGATFSHQKHTRRFAIVLLDLMRKALLMSIEYDNSLMRDPIIIYTLTLICHTGLWCGNKRAFELAESIRGSVVNYCRRTGFGGTANNSLEVTRSSENMINDVNSQWKRWISEETQKRLCWAVYSLDCQFPSLLNLPATICRSEISVLGCPCDNEFWQAPSAWHWRRLLGPASVPPSVSFATAIGPFLIPSIIGTSKQHQKNGQGRPLMIKLNDWSRHLVLLSIQIQIYEFSQELTVVGKVCGDENTGDFLVDEAMCPSSTNPLAYSSHGETRVRPQNISQPLSVTADQIRRRVRSSAFTKNSSIWQRLADTKLELSDSLLLWSTAYSEIRSATESSTEVPNYFTQSSGILEKLGRIMLDVSLTDLQDAIGKSGAAKIPTAMSNLSLWIRCSPQSIETASESLQIIQLLSPPKRKHAVTLSTSSDTPFSIITYFICHIILWAFVILADQSRKDELKQIIETCGNLYNAPIASLLKRLLAPQNHEPEDEANHAKTSQKLLFRSAADGLARMGTWGCGLNLAMMLHKRVES